MKILLPIIAVSAFLQVAAIAIILPLHFLGVI
jgi:hypothetical protein